MLASRVHSLVQINSEATKLGMTGVHPSQSYGYQAMGASVSQQRNMRNNLKGCTPFAGTIACTTTSLCWTFGTNADPYISCPIGQVDLWMQVWAAAPAVDKQDARYTWHLDLCNFLDEGIIQSNQLVGPAIATIQALQDIGWKPVRPDFWVVDDTTNVKVDLEPFTKLQILARASQDLQKKVWRQAASHEHGGGLEKGIPSFKAALHAVKCFRKHGMHA